MFGNDLGDDNGRAGIMPNCRAAVVHPGPPAERPTAVQIWWRFAFAYTAPMFAHTLFRKRCAIWLLAIGIFLMLGSCAEKPSELERIARKAYCA